jgi:hypothetical protein
VRIAATAGDFRKWSVIIRRHIRRATQLCNIWRVLAMSTTIIQPSIPDSGFPLRP